MNRVLLLTVMTALLVVGVPAQRSSNTGPHAALTVSAAEDSAFSIAVLPDTQNEVYGNDNRFANRTKWLVDNQSQLDLRYVLHTGDMVSWDTTDHRQYGWASAAMKNLDDASIPWMGAIGNHDTAAVCPGGSACPGQSAHDNLRNTTTFNSYFPVSRFPNISGLYEAGKVDNAWGTFAAGGEDWLVLTLELWPRSSIVSWAANVIASHPKHNVIIVTHSFLNGSGGVEQGQGGYGDNSPQYIYNKLVLPYGNVKMVFSGHIGIAGSRVDVRPDGSKVAEFLGTFHSNTTNPTQIVTINTSSGLISTRFYAPWANSSWPEYSATVAGMSWASGNPIASPTVALRSVANGKYVTAEGGGTLPLIASRERVGAWESFTLLREGGNDVALLAHADSEFVCAESAGAAPLVANRSWVGPWETFELLTNSDGTVSFRSRANSRFVTAEAGGSGSLIANRAAIGPWEKFFLQSL